MLKMVDFDAFLVTDSVHKIEGLRGLRQDLELQSVREPARRRACLVDGEPGVPPLAGAVFPVLADSTSARQIPDRAALVDRANRLNSFGPKVMTSVDG
jgi:hypothetical protein